MSSTSTGIEWTNATWNPIRGCSRVSEGCRNCYAERLAIRQKATGYQGLVKSTKDGPRWTGEVLFVEKALTWPLRCPKPLRIFVNSMSDLFHEKVQDEWIAAIFGVMLRARQHTFQILTKRPERMHDWMRTARPADCLATLAVTQPAASALTAHEAGEIGADWPPRHIHLGVSVEDQATADERIPLLLQSPAAVRWVSYEPALDAVVFEDAWMHHYGDGPPGNDLDRGLDWIVVGGESGPGARPFDLAWARSTIAQCRAAGVKVFVKQLGAQPVYYNVKMNPYDGARTPLGGLHLRDRKGGDWTEWPADLRVREFPGCSENDSRG